MTLKKACILFFSFLQTRGFIVRCIDFRHLYYTFLESKATMQSFTDECISDYSRLSVDVRRDLRQLFLLDQVFRFSFNVRVSMGSFTFSFCGMSSNALSYMRSFTTKRVPCSTSRLAAKRASRWWRRKRRKFGRSTGG